MLQRDSTTSLYEQIAQQLLAEIHQGAFGKAGKLPSESALTARFGVSRVTIRLALGQLEAEGAVERKQGKGTFVAEQQVRHDLDALRSFHEALLVQGLQPSMRLLGQRRLATPDALAALLGPQCVEVERLHYADGEPIAFARSYLTDAVAAVDWGVLGETPLYSVLEQVTGRPVAKADVAIRACAADKAMARHLGVKAGTALLVMARTSWFGEGQCCDRTTFYIRPERYAFVVSGIFRAAGR